MTTAVSQALEEKRARLREWIPEGTEDSVTLGVDHIAVFVKDIEATAAFYTQVMGMPVVRVTANRDVPESTHMNVAIGNGMTFAFFDFPGRAPPPASLTGGGWRYHARGPGHQPRAP